MYEISFKNPFDFPTPLGHKRAISLKAIWQYPEARSKTMSTSGMLGLGGIHTNFGVDLIGDEYPGSAFRGCG